MISRRKFIQASVASSITLSLGTDSFAERSHVNHADPTKWVDPRIGTGGHGHCYPGATVPFGAVQLSPDTFNEGWDRCSGYHISDNSIMGFSHNHLSGTGRGDLLDILVMAGTGTAHLTPGSRENPDEGYRSRFDHADEQMEPGYYSVILKDYDIRAELTVTERVGLHRYTFPASDQAYLILDLHHGFDPRKLIIHSAELALTAPATISGGRVTSSWAKNRHNYFTMQLSKTPEKIVFFSDDQKVSAPSDSELLRGTNLKAVLYFKTEQGEQILVKTGISGVSAEGAAENIRAELPGQNFDAVRKAAYAAWRRELLRMQIEPGVATDDQLKVFYTALYHAMLAPTIFDDVDGQYRGMDGRIHQLEAGQHNFSTYSLWDTYRALHPLYTLIQPKRIPVLVNGLIRMAHESSAGPAVWPLQGCEIGGMTGYHSAVVIAEAYAKGFRGFDPKAAYEPYRKRAMTDDYRGLAAYRKYGYIPCDLELESASKTLDYAYDDWAIGKLAEAAGETADHAMLLKRSQNYRNLFDSSTGFIRPRFSNNEWASTNGTFDPKEISITRKWRDYTESNAWQATFGVQHDPQGLIDLFGGREAFIAKLDGLFNQSPDMPPDTPKDVAGLVGMYAHGNEPSHHIAYLYNYAGAPWKTQAMVSRLLTTMYPNAPDGLAGNEDCGQMSAWYIMSSLGLYAVDPVSAIYVLTSPLFDKATITVSDGKQLIVEARRTSPDAIYIQSVTINGKKSHKLWVHHDEIAHGGHIQFELSSVPNQELGTASEFAPPSLTRNSDVKNGLTASQ